MRRAAVGLGAVVSLAVGISVYAEKAAAPDLFLAPVSDDQKIVHALNRLTFGPRPGDFDEVKNMGLKKWIDLELHPGRIAENPQLESKIAPLDTLRMGPALLARRYPPPQLIKAMVDGKAPYPSDPAERMMVESAARRIKAREGKDAGEKPTLASVGLTEDQQRVLERGSPGEKLKVFEGLLDEQKDEVLEAMPQPARISLFTAAPPDLRRRIQKAAGPQAVIAQDLTEAKLLRAIYSNRQFEEVLTDFWYNHFNVFLDKGADRYLVSSYERDVIRPHVLGKFKDLLVATAESPAMLFYLDNVQSVGPNTPQRNARRRGRQPRPQAKTRAGLNENYARELMELHTLGVDGGYTQHDVTEVARCFTGWSIRPPAEGSGFIFRERQHDNGSKKLLGVKIKKGGDMKDGLKVLDILAHHPSTARFISKKLAMRFVADEPPQSLIDKMARTFRERDGDLRLVLETMLSSPEFWSQGAYRAKLKSPLEMVASAVRALGADVDFSFALSQQLAQLGQPLYRKQEPTGYPNTGQEWMNSASLLARMNFAVALASNRIPGVTVDSGRFGNDDTDRIARDLLLVDLSDQARAAIDAGVKTHRDPAPSSEETGSDAGLRRQGIPRMALGPPHPVARPLIIAGLILGSPDFQRR